MLPCVLVLWASWARAEDKVYQYRNREGREVFTNAGRIEVGGTPLAPVALPELTQLDLSSASAGQLQQLDRDVQRAHDALQSGARCEAIRATSRVRKTAFVWREHVRELTVAGGLLMVALIVLGAWPGRLRRLMPIAPLLGCVYLGYATYVRVEQRLTLLREGLRACSSDLPPAQGADPSAVKQRLESALSLQATIDRAYQQRGDAVEQLMNER